MFLKDNYNYNNMELLKNNEEVSQIENILVEKDSIKEILLNDFEMVKEKIESIRHCKKII